MCPLVSPSLVPLSRSGHWRAPSSPDTAPQRCVPCTWGGVIIAVEAEVQVPATTPSQGSSPGSWGRGQQPGGLPKEGGGARICGKGGCSPERVPEASRAGHGSSSGLGTAWAWRGLGADSGLGRDQRARRASRGGNPIEGLEGGNGAKEERGAAVRAMVGVDVAAVAEDPGL